MVLLTLLLAPEGLAAQFPAAATAPPSMGPELAEFIPLATVVSSRLARLKRASADGVALPQIAAHMFWLVIRMVDDIGTHKLILEGYKYRHDGRRRRDGRHPHRFKGDTHCRQTSHR